jgi:acyl-CoA synthetase (AMP-forming)/AMP-acid ligase II
LPGETILNGAGERIFGLRLRTPSAGKCPWQKWWRDGNGSDANDLRRFCYQHLARYKVPKDFEFVDELPKTTSGKLKR